MKRTTAAVLLLLLTAGTAWLAVAVLDPPSPLSADALPGEFSAARAMEHVRALARSPRPMGTEAHSEARRYLLEEIEALGLTPEVQTAVGRHPRASVLGTVRNVVARLPGEAGREGDAQAVLLVAHHDSVHTGPGASDDAVGVAVLLETLRALAAGPALSRDVVALFTDAEEPGLLGAEAFADEHPLAERTGVVLNFEARGTRGPSLMFETGPGNRRVIEHFAGAPRPMGASYSYEIYRRLPNDTDFTVFKDRGTPGLNFAHIHGAVGYHTARDSIERLDAGSLQHHGANALALARSFGDADPSRLRDLAADGDAVYFNLLGPVFVSYPASWTLPLLIVLALLAVGAVGYGVVRRKVRIGGVLLALLAQAVVAALLFAFAGAVRGALFPVSYDFRIWGDGSSVAWTLFGSTLAALGVAAGLHRILSRWLRWTDLASAGVLLWLVFSVLLALTAPGASYLTMVPLLFQAVAVGALLAAPQRTVAPGEAPAAGDPGPAGPIGAPAFVLASLAAVITALVWAPTLALVAVGLQVAATAPLAAAAGLLVALLAPQVEWIAGRRPGSRLGTAAVALLIAAGLAVVATARAAGGFGPDNPAPTGLLYAEDGDTGEALWVSAKLRPDPWTSRVLPEEPETRSMPALLGSERRVAVGPVDDPIGLPVPRLEPFGERGGGAPLSLRVVPPEGADRLVLSFSPPEAVDGLRVAGHAMEVALEGAPRITYHAPPEAGVALEIESSDPDSLELRVVAVWVELPSEEQGGPGPKPPGLMTTGVSRTADTTMVERAWRVGDLEPSSGDGDGGGDASTVGDDAEPGDEVD